MNALAAIAATRALGLSLESIIVSLSEFENIKGRLTVLTAESGCRVIDDTYNANPLSVSAAIDVLAEMQGDATDKTVLVLGDMAELGESAESLHAEIGEKAKVVGVAALYATGVLSVNTVNAFGENGFHFQDKEKLISTYPYELNEGSWWGDTYWGKVDGEGENKLGILLKKIRGEYINQNSNHCKKV